MISALKELAQLIQLSTYFTVPKVLNQAVCNGSDVAMDAGTTPTYQLHVYYPVESTHRSKKSAVRSHQRTQCCYHAVQCAVL